MTGVVEMGRPKKGVKKATDAPADDRSVIVHLKGSAAYAAWLEGIHAKTHIPKATLFRLAMADWAEKNGHPSPPEI